MSGWSRKIELREARIVADDNLADALGDFNDDSYTIFLSVSLIMCFSNISLPLTLKIDIQL